VKIYKTPPFKHQMEALRRSKDAPFFALLMEQGTGKSKVTIDTAAHLWRKGKIDTLMIVAPNGVAPGWINEQFPMHMPEDVEYVAGRWRAPSALSKTSERQLREILTITDKLRIIVMNIEAFGSTAAAIDFAIDVLDAAQSALLVIDESHRIKTPNAHTTKRIMNLRARAAFRRILTGTPITQGPFDAFTQFNFLSPTILDTDSFVAFKSEYAELMTEDHGLMRHITRRVPKTWKGRYLDEDGKPIDVRFDPDGVPRQKYLEPKYIPALVMKNDDGTPKYRNLDKLQKLIAPHSFRVLKKDCLDLPEQLYNRYYTQLTPKQAQLYVQVRDKMRIEWAEGRISALNKLTQLLRLQQIVCGYVGDDDGTIVNLFADWSSNPRVLSLLELIADRPEEERAIIWCRFTEDIRQVAAALGTRYGKGLVVQYHGKMKDKDREEAKCRFRGERPVLDRKGNVVDIEVVPEAERARFIIGQQHAGGIGQNWVAGSLVVYYSNNFSLDDRLQSEDRAHRIGQERVVQYIDIEAEDTIDGKIITALRAKKDIADAITGDPSRHWLD